MHTDHFSSGDRSRRPLKMLALVLLTSCSGAPEEPVGQAGEPAAARPSSIASFGLDAMSTRIDIGGHQPLETDARFTRVRGALGVFSTDRVNGTWLAFQRRPQSDRAQIAHGNVQSHNLAVREYFESVGLPASQTGDVEGTLLVEAQGPIDEVIKAMPAPSLRGFISTVRRRVEGIDVVDSFATARVDAEGKPILELVYWPQLSRQVVDEAKAVRDSFQTSDGRASVVQSMPGYARERLEAAGKVVIIHGRMASPGAPEPARVAIEVPPRANTNERQEYFSSAGAPLRQDEGEGP